MQIPVTLMLALCGIAVLSRKVWPKISRFLNGIVENRVYQEVPVRKKYFQRIYPCLTASFFDPCPWAAVATDHRPVLRVVMLSLICYSLSCGKSRKEFLFLLGDGWFPNHDTGEMHARPDWQQMQGRRGNKSQNCHQKMAKAFPREEKTFGGTWFELG